MSPGNTGPEIQAQKYRKEQITNTLAAQYTQASDPAAELLLQREVQALKLMTAVRFMLMMIMAPMVWLLGVSFLDQIATFVLVVFYTIIVVISAHFVRQRRHLTGIGLTGVALDIFTIGALPLIWFNTLGSGETLPAGMTLKTSVTLFAVLLVALNTLAMRPLYPLLVTAGALLIHFVLLAAALLDEQTRFTTNYLIAYTTPEVSSGRVTTRILILLLTGIMLTLLTMRARNMIIEAVQLQKINDQLGRYFSPNLVRRLAENPALFRVGGERKDLSFVFTDLEGFTTLVENHDPAVVAPLLNDYLNELVQVAFKHEGTVEKIVGDALHIIFGAPVNQPDHAARAVACALELDQVAERYRQRLAAEIPLGVTRIGVNSGSAIVGNFGSDAFFDYTAHGDAINTAARLEGANKYLGTRICVSAETASRVPGFYGRPIGILWLKGKSQGTEVFQPLSETDMDSSALQVYLDAYELLKNEHPAASARFTELFARYPEDRLVRFHLERLNAGYGGIKITLDGK